MANVHLKGVLFLFLLLGLGGDCYKTREKNVPLSISKGFPNVILGKVNAHETITYEIEDPKYIQGFNSSTTRILIKATVRENATSNYPVFFHLVQRHDTESLYLPYKGNGNVKYVSASRILCHPTKSDDGHENSILIKVSSGSFEQIDFQIEILVNDLLKYRMKKVNYDLITPTTPLFYHYDEFHNSSNVVINVLSDNKNCLAVQVQQPNCPVFHFDDNFGPGSKWEIFSEHGAIRVDMRNYLKGFFIKIKLLMDDSLCGNPNSSPLKRRASNVSISVRDDMSTSLHENQYFWIAIALPLGITIFIGLVVAVMYLVSYSVTRKQMISCGTEVPNENRNVVSVQKFSRTTKHKSANFGKWTILISLFFLLPVLDQTIYNFMVSKNAGIYGRCSYNSLCAHSFWIFKDFNHLLTSTSHIILGLCFILITFCKRCLREKSDQDEGIQFYAGLYYSMGVALIIKGVASAVYHLCPSKTNAQYDIIYLSIVVCICLLKTIEVRRPKTFSVRWCCGVLALCFIINTVGMVFERNTEMNDIWGLAFFIFRIVVGTIQGIFTFYASVYAIYIGYPINRSPKVFGNEEIPLQDMVIAELQHQQQNSRTPVAQNFMKSISEIPRFFIIFPKIWQWKLPTSCRWERFVFVVLMLGVNGLLIFYSLQVNYTLYVLLVLSANFGLNFIHYFFMKIVCGEFACKWKSIQVFIFLVFGILFGVLAGYYFIENLGEWTQPSTHARVGDESCQWLSPFPFYDKHDAWHLFSANALFFLFMVLLSIDDGVEGVDRDYLLVF